MESHSREIENVKENNMEILEHKEKGGIRKLHIKKKERKLRDGGCIKKRKLLLLVDCLKP